MNFLKAVLGTLAILLAPSIAAAQTTQASMGYQAGANPRNLCVYDLSAAHVCVAIGAVNDVSHTFIGGSASMVPWSGVTGTPTTLGGYGIASPLNSAQGGTGAASPTGYSYFNGVSAATFSTTIPSASTTFTGPGANALSTTVAIRDTNSPLNAVADYHAVCDSSTDNSIPLQHWITDSITLNKLAYLPGCALKYNYGTTLSATAAGLFRMQGDSRLQSILNYTGTSTAILISPSAYTSHYADVRDVSFYAGTLTTSQRLISIVNAGLSLFENVGLYNQWTCFAADGQDFALRLIGVYATQCGTSAGGAAIAFDNDFSANGAVIENGGIFGGGGYSIVIPNGQSIGIHGMDIENNYGGVEVGGGTGGVQSLDISGANYIENSGAGGNLNFAGTIGAGTNVSNLNLANDWLGPSSNVNVNNVVGFSMNNLTLFNFALSIASTSNGTIGSFVQSGTGGLTWGSTVTHTIPPGTVANLPAASANTASTAVVTDATACTAGSSPTGGGSTICPEYSNGSAWIH